MKQKLTVLLFLTLMAVAIWGGWGGMGPVELPPRMEAPKDLRAFLNESYLKNIRLHLTQNNQRAVQLAAKELVFYQDKALGPGVFSFAGKWPLEGGGELSFQGEVGKLTSPGEYVFQRNVQLFNDKVALKCDRGTYRKKERVAHCEGKAQISSFMGRRSLVLEAAQLTAMFSQQVGRLEGKVGGRLSLGANGQSKVSFKAQAAMVDWKTGKVELKEDLWLHRNAFKAQAHRGELFFEKTSGRLRRFTLQNDVRLTETVRLPGAKKIYERKALAEKLEGIPEENLIILTGSPRVYQMDDVVRGGRITLRRDVELIEVERAHSIFFLKDGSP